MDFYNNMQKISSQLLKQYGSDFILKKPDGEVYNPVIKKSIKKHKEYSGICVMRPYTAEMIGTLSNIINAGDVQFKCLMNDKSIIPTEGVDMIVFKSANYDIIGVDETNPNGNKILIHTLHCRRANSGK